MPENHQTPPPVRRRISALETLSELMLAPRALVVPMDGEEIEMIIRGLTSVEAAQVDKIQAPVPPPKMVPNPRLAGQRIEDGLDFDDPKFIEANRVYRGLVRAATIDAGLVEMSVPGDTFEAKSDWLKANLPPRAIDLLEGKIRELTANPITTASFSSASGSVASRS